MQEEKEEEPLCGDDGEFLKGRERERGEKVIINLVIIVISMITFD